MMRSAAPAKQSKQTILVVGPSWVGDMVMAQCLFKILKAQNPDCIIDVLAPAHSGPLIERMPQVRQLIPMPLKHGEFALKKRYQMGRELRDKGYDSAYVLPNSWKSALIPFFAHIRERIGWLGEQRFALLNQPKRLNKLMLPLMIQRFAALALGKQVARERQLPWPELVVSEHSRAKVVQELGLNTDQRPILALCPGAEFGPAKRWPTRHYAAVANAHLAQGGQVWLFGSAKESVDAQDIMRLTNGRCLDLCGKTSLAQAIDSLSLVDAVVSNDSGLMHIASALKRPLVVIYGSSDPGFTPPLAKNKQIVSKSLPCSPCFARTCPLDHNHCLEQLLPEQVLSALAMLESAHESDSLCSAS